MMSKTTYLFGLLMLSCAGVVSAQVPVSDTRSVGYSSGYAATGMSQGQGELFMQLQQLQEEVSRLRGMLEEQQYEIKRIKQENLERYQEVEGRLSQQAAPAVSPVTSPSLPAAVPPTAPTANTTPADPAKEKLFYDAAFDLIKARDFAKADLAFAAFLRKYPKGQYSGNAQYWLGEVKLAQKDLVGASQAFTAVYRDYPDNSKVPDALYKLGDVERQRGDSDKARGLFLQVIRLHPNSSAAKLAQRSLEQL